MRSTLGLLVAISLFSAFAGPVSASAGSSPSLVLTGYFVTPLYIKNAKVPGPGSGTDGGASDFSTLASGSANHPMRFHLTSIFVRSRTCYLHQWLKDASGRWTIQDTQLFSGINHFKINGYTNASGTPATGWNVSTSTGTGSGAAHVLKKAAEPGDPLGGAFCDGWATGTYSMQLHPNAIP